jgi:hypothetical protein
MAIRPSMKTSWKDLYCEFSDARHGLQMWPLHLVVILIYKGGFEQPVTED